MFTEYSNLEKVIFNKVKDYFEKMPSVASDDYKNGFSDLVAQYGSGGQDYLAINGMFEDVVESTILTAYENFPESEQKELQIFYERNFLNNYYNSEKDEYEYTDDDLAVEIMGRFKTWMNDNFSEEDV
jgi:hypothetical protein